MKVIIFLESGSFHNSTCISSGLYFVPMKKRNFEVNCARGGTLSRCIYALIKRARWERILNEAFCSTWHTNHRLWEYRVLKTRACLIRADPPHFRDQSAFLPARLTRSGPRRRNVFLFNEAKRSLSRALFFRTLLLRCSRKYFVLIYYH